jgi:TonB family protein
MSRTTRTRRDPAAWIALLLGLLLAGAGAATTGATTDPPRVPGEDGVTFPQKIKNVLPDYPMGASRTRKEGAVNLRFVVRQDGDVDAVEVIDSSNPGNGFEEAAQKAIRNWRYAPAMHDGKPVDVTMEISVEFSPEEVLEQKRWHQIEEGLKALARAQVYPEGAHIAGEDGVTWPVATKQKKAIYPHGARVRRIESGVTLLLLIDEEGGVADIPLGHSQNNDYPFKEAAMDSVREWRFRPATLDGQPVATYHWILIHFPSQAGKP